jgi:hypothetical protein
VHGSNEAKGPKQDRKNHYGLGHTCLKEENISSYSIIEWDFLFDFWCFNATFNNISAIS